MDKSEDMCDEVQSQITRLEFLIAVCEVWISIMVNAWILLAIKLMNYVG